MVRVWPFHGGGAGVGMITSEVRTGVPGTRVRSEPRGGQPRSVPSSPFSPRDLADLREGASPHRAWRPSHLAGGLWAKATLQTSSRSLDGGMSRKGWPSITPAEPEDRGWLVWACHAHRRRTQEPGGVLSCGVIADVCGGCFVTSEKSFLPFQEGSDSGLSLLFPSPKLPGQDFIPAAAPLGLRWSRGSFLRGRV